MAAQECVTSLEDQSYHYRRPFKFDGELSQHRPWKSRVRDHVAEDWQCWREILADIERWDGEITWPVLQGRVMFGVEAERRAADLWSFLLRWIGPTLYLHRTKMQQNIPGNGFELWRKPVARYEGSDELVTMAGRSNR